MEFCIKSRVQELNNERKGQVVYYARPKMKRYVSAEEVARRIEEATSLTRGDVWNALISLTKVVKDELRNGSLVDLGELGSLQLVVGSRMVGTPEEVTVANALKTPKIVFRPKKAMLESVKRVRLTIDHGTGVANVGE